MAQLTTPGPGPSPSYTDGSPHAQPAPISMATSPAYQISREHCYPHLAPLRSSYDQSFFPKSVLFPGCVQGWAEPCGSDSTDSSAEGKERGECGETDEDKEEDEEGELDVVSVPLTMDLPYDEPKVGVIMMECVRHLNLVKTPPNANTSELLLGRAMAEGSYQQRVLLCQLVKILRADHLARLVCSSSPHEPIKRRLNCDRAARQFRKAFSDVHWDPKLTRWAHETLLQCLDSDLLAIYLDILQVLKAKCPVLVEHMIHASVATVGGEAFGLLLKRPWNPVAGMHPLDKMVKFEPPPIFITLPYASTGLGGRRWRIWQTQLGTIGKVYPIVLPEVYSDPRQSIHISDLAERIIIASLGRVQELRAQFPTRPVVLLGWSMAARIACKIAEVERISLIVSLGLPCKGMGHQWKVSSDPFRTCKVPTMFAVGTDGHASSVEYVESLRSLMCCPTSLIAVGGGDDLLRLSSQDKAAEETTQSIIDRCILEKIYQFIVHELPCSFPDETRHSRKRKASHTEEVGPAHLTPAAPQSPILLCSPAPGDESELRNFNFNNSNPLLWRTVMGLRHARQGSPLSPSPSPSPVPFHERRPSVDGLATPLPKKLLSSSETAGLRRPRSRSTAEKPCKVLAMRYRSKSSDQQPSSGSLGSSPISLLSLGANTNANNSNEAGFSPPGSPFGVPPVGFQPLPVTPPRNPFEDPQSNLLDPKTLKQLQRR